MLVGHGVLLQIAGNPASSSAVGAKRLRTAQRGARTKIGGLPLVMTTKENAVGDTSTSRGGEFRAIVESSRPPPLIRCNWLRGSRSFANICCNQGCGRAEKFSCNGWSCNLKGRQFFYCSSRCHKAEVDRLVAAMVADRPRGCLKNSWEY